MISARGAELVSLSLGSVGKKLCTMFDTFGNHPETDSFFFDDSDLSICDLLNLADYAKKSKIDFFFKHLPFLAESQASEKFKKSRLPSKNGYRARFLRKPLREEARKARKIQQVCSNSFINSLLIFWQQIPEDFSLFARSRSLPRFSEDEILGFKKMGCRNLALVTKDFHERFKNPPCFFGYKKLGVIDACKIVAKLNACSSDESRSKIVFQDNSCYRPLIVPLHLVKNVPQIVNDAVNDAEYCNSLFFDSAFDNYVVVVPWSNKLTDRDVVFELANSWQGCVLGERDGEFYFIVGVN
jgi:hypothetical protein